MSNNPGGADESITIVYVVETADAIKKYQEMRQQIDETKRQLLDMQKQTGGTFKDLGAAMKESAKAEQAGLEKSSERYKELGTTIKTIPAATQELTKSTKEANAEAEKGAASWTRFGNAIKLAFGLGIIQVLRMVFGYLRESVQSAYEFAKAVFGIEIAARALRRSGVDITTKDIYQNLEKLRQEFGTFSTKELVQGAAAFFNLNRDMGFTKEQLFELQKAIATLAVVNGRSMDEVQKTVALALSSGYTEGLQRLGVSINRVTIAEEAARIGYAKSYMALTETQRAEATYNLVLQKTAKYSNDVAKYQETWAGQLDKVKAKVEDQKAVIGLELIPTQKLWYDAVLVPLGNILYYIARGIGAMERALVLFYNMLNGMDLLKPVQTFKNWAKAIKDAAEDMMKFRKAWEGGFNMAGWEEYQGSLGGMPAVETPLKEEQAAQEQTDLVNSLFDTLYSETEKHQQDLKDLEHEYWDDLAEIDREGARKRFEALSEHLDKLNDIEKSTVRDFEDAQIDYERERQKILNEAATGEIESKNKLAEKLLKIQRDYEEKLLKLREEFVLDLEDAIENRDARQILQLTRRYNLEKRQLERERKLKELEATEEYQKEIKEAVDQRAKKLQLLEDEYRYRREDIARNREREIEDEAIRFKRELDDLAANLQAQKDERAIKYKDQLDEMNAAFDARINTVLAKLLEEKKITAEQLNAIAAEYEATYGPNGRIEAAIRYYISMMESLAGMSTSGGTGINYGNMTGTYLPQHATGGDVIANSPQIHQFGEVPELVSFRPLSQLNTNSMGTLGTGGGKVAIELQLSPDLQARIVSNTLGKVADVVLDVVQRNA